MAVVLDTHTAIWYFSSSILLSNTALSAIDSAVHSSEDVFLSAISLIEVTYLTEKGKLPPDAVRKLEEALQDANSSIVVASVDIHVAKALAPDFQECDTGHARPHHRRDCRTSSCASDYAGSTNTGGRNSNNLVRAVP